MHPGPAVSLGRFQSRGVHRVRFNEKLRGISTVTHNILVGGRDEASDKELLDRHGVTHVLNACKQLQNFHPDSYTYLKINAVDDPSYDIREDFEAASRFLARAEERGGRVLVHCVAGVSR